MLIKVMFFDGKALSILGDIVLHYALTSKNLIFYSHKTVCIKDSFVKAISTWSGEIFNNIIKHCER